MYSDASPLNPGRFMICNPHISKFSRSSYGDIIGTRHRNYAQLGATRLEAGERRKWIRVRIRHRRFFVAIADRARVAHRARRQPLFSHRSRMSSQFSHLGIAGMIADPGE